MLYGNDGSVATRRAVRSYTDEPIDNYLIRELVEAATLAPSAMNLQPWAFVVVNGSARLQGLSDEAKRYICPKGHRLLVILPTRSSRFSTMPRP
ncbi:nitroreductase family protein [Mesorhizobium sp. ORM6]